MNSSPVLVLALDPGETSGYAYGVVEDGRFEFRRAGQGEYSEAELWFLLESISPLYLIAEGFDFRQKARDGLVLYSRNLLGVCELWAEICDREYIEQSAAKGLSFFTDAKLSKMGCDSKGLPHARDATRHLMNYMFFRAGFKLHGEGLDEFRRRTCSLPSSNN